MTVNYFVLQIAIIFLPGIIWMAVVGPAGENDVEIAATACKRNSAFR